MADFQFYLNRQGIRGLQGVKGDPGDSPIITVQTETPNEYILKITNPDGTELISPNLRGNKININEGTYVRYNTETGELYTSTADGATGELAGVVRLATDVDINNMDERAAVTPSQLTDALSKYLVSPNGSVKIIQNADTSLTELTVVGGLTDVPIASADTLGVVKIGENLSITADGVLSSTAGGGDVYASGNNTFTGTNDFNGAVNLNGITTAENLTVARNLTSSGEINAVSIKSTGIRSDDIKTTTNKKYLTEEDVDNQTIQIVDDKLHANFDGISGEINDVSSRVTSLEGQVGDISTTLGNNTTDIENLKETKNNNIFDIDKFTVVGSPTITDDGIASGFTRSNYLQVKLDNISSSVKVKICSKFKTFGQAGEVLWNFVSRQGMRVQVQAKNLIYLVLYTAVGQVVVSLTLPTDFDASKYYYCMVSFDGMKYAIEILDENGNSIGSSEYSSSEFLFTWNLPIRLGQFVDTDIVNMKNIKEIDLKQFSITVDGKEVFNGLMESTKPIYDKITTLNTNVSDFELETSNNFSAVNSALNEKANLSDLGLKQNILVEGDNITLTNNGDGTTTISASGTISPTIELVDGGNASAT